METSENNLALLGELYLLLESEKIDTWIFGGWGEELRNMILPRIHNDIDLLYIGKDFDTIDTFIKKYNLKILKSYAHKRAFSYHGIMIEIFLVRKNESTLETDFFSNYKYQWPDDSFTESLTQGFRVASINCLISYRKNHSEIRSLSEK